MAQLSADCEHAVIVDRDFDLLWDPYPVAREYTAVTRIGWILGSKKEGVST